MKKFFLIANILTISFVFSVVSLAVSRSHAHTMRAVAPESFQNTSPNPQPSIPKVDEESTGAEEFDFDDDFSVLV